MKKFHRRTMLQGLGLSAAAFGLSFRGGRVYGQQPSIPKRIIFLGGSSGSLPGWWQPTPSAGAPAATETSWELGPSMAALAGYKGLINIFENLHMLSADVDPIGPTNAHMNGSTHALTGANRLASNLAGGVSIDQIIAQGLVNSGTLTRLPSLELISDYQYFADPSERIWVQAMPGSILPALWDPNEIYNRLFPSGPADLNANDPRLAQRSRVLDFVSQQMNRLDDSRLPRGTRLKIEQHSDVLSSLRSRLLIGAGRAYNIPTKDAILKGWAYSNPTYEQRGALWDQMARLHVDLVVAGLSADVTRVVTIDLHDAHGSFCNWVTSPTTFYRDGDFGTSGIHDLIHRVNNPADPLANNPDARGVIRNQILRTQDIIKYLLDRLSLTVEPDGSHLIDHTLVVFHSQIGAGSHSLHDLPWYTVGNAQGYFRTGRYIRSTTPRAHNDLFVSVANAMGVGITTMGNPNVCTGPLAGLL